MVSEGDGLKSQIEEAIQTLEAIYFFTPGLREKENEHLSRLRWDMGYMLTAGYPKLLTDIQRDVAAIRVYYGALASDEFYRDLLSEAYAAEGKGLIYISKLRIVRDIFSEYQQSIVRWPHIKLHSFVMFDPKVGFQNMLFEIEGQLFHDAQFMLYKSPSSPRRCQNAARPALYQTSGLAHAFAKRCYGAFHLR